MLAWRFRWGAAVSVAGMLVGVAAAAQTEGAPDTTTAMPRTPATPQSAPEGAASPGLYLGASLGLGELHFGYGRNVFWGRSYSVGLSAGGALTPNLILFGQLYDAHVFGPSSTYGELSALDFLGVGPGLKYYLTPTRLFLSASLMLSKAHFGIDGAGAFPDMRMAVDESTNWGATFRLALGKSWQMSRGWSVGLEGEALYGRMTYDAQPDERSTVKSFSLLVSAAYGHDTVEHGPGRRRGLHLEVRGGAGLLRFSSGGATASGPGAPLGVSAGTSLTRRLALFADFSYLHMSSPSGAGASFDSGAVYGFGPRAKYTLTSNDLFVSAAPYLAEVSIEGGAQSHWGWGGDLSVGKEWWLTPHWAVGLAGDLFRVQVSGSIDSAPVIEGASLQGLVAYSEEAVPRDTPDAADERDDGGNFFIESRGGIGHLWTRYGVDFASGTIVPLELSVGHLFSPRLAVLADFTYARVPDLSSDLYTALQSARAHGFGLRAKYYLQPGSIFVEAALGYTHFSFSNTWPYYTPGPQSGVAAHVTVGKEWWLLRHWAIGLGGDLLLGAVEGGEDGMHVPKALSLLVLLAYNSPRSNSHAGTSTVETDGAPAAAVAAEQFPVTAGAPPEQEAERAAAVTAPAPTRQPHQGFHAGARLGAGWLDVTQHSGSGNSDYRIHGFGAPFALSAGWALTREWVVFGEFFEHQVRHPKNSFGTGLIDVDLIAVGPGVSYYGLPAGLFLSTSLSLSQVSYRDGTPLDTRYGTNVTSHWGYTGRLSVGEEWRPSSYWGLGVAAEAALGRMNGSSIGADTKYTVKTLSALAIFNFD